MAIGDIIEYHVVSNRELGRVVDVVNDYIKDGWEVYGGLVIDNAQYSTFVLYCQAIVKRKQPPLLTDNTKVIL